MWPVPILVALFASAGLWQERSPDGRVYRELLPFVHLEGVRFELRGLEGGVLNVPGPIAGEPWKTVTSLSLEERERLAREIRDDAAEALTRAGIPVLSSDRSSQETKPVLVVDLHWYRPRADLIGTHVAINLMEAAHPLRDPSQIVWSPSWSVSNYGVASPQDLAFYLRRLTGNMVGQFIGLYVRAHR